MPPKKNPSQKKVEKKAEEKPKKGRNQPVKRKAEEPVLDVNQDNNNLEESGGYQDKKAKVENQETQLRLSNFVTTKKDIDFGDGKFSSSPIKIASWNVNGLRSVIKRGELLSYIKKANPDILCLNETKISEKDLQADPNLLKIHQDYYHFFNCSKDKLGYSGVAILTKQKPISVKFDIGHMKHDGEGRTITAEFEKFNLVACYVPNAGQKLDRLNYRVNEWDPAFRKFLADLKAKKPTILCGDLNVSHKEIDIHNPKGNKRSAGFTDEERQSFSEFLNDGWIDTFRNLYPTKVMYTYYSIRFNAKAKNAGWRLDYFVIDKDSMKAVKDSGADNDTVGSDHIPIVLTLDLDNL